MEALEQYLKGLKEQEDKAEKRKEEHKAARQVRANEMREKIKVGTLLHYSWGFEQTQCEFYQVVERKGATIKMRPIAGEEVGERAMHAMSCHYKPVRDSFVGDEVITKRIGPYGIAMDFGTASITREDEKHYCSWYG
jgi:L-rhamnose mutarotase